ncbi:MAG: tRNA (5-methylaminomethyl-2-thiouridine)(34)-methyltransferase MnmD [Dysgonamonadaceae bacterium]|jgi:tRNA U34 5-methylaminomethyl-2-thiouridine-forming methyltransferase MnmC|nr:tRNA (5-methylaminomethyl-2-thiouridine)(34)-methyltransferase MnmD [Dysgonamonadaceae bacterium]
MEKFPNITPLLQVTADGSHTISLPEMDEHYHSINGAIQESQHVYIEAGFKQIRKPEIHVIEMGFGTGLNALLTAIASETQETKVIYTALEKFPLPQEIINRLNYSDINPALFHAVHQAEWGKVEPVAPSFYIEKIQIDFRAFDFRDKYDVVYYDAFAPGKQPEVWSQELFNRIFAAMNTQGVVVTYCASGGVRRMMRQAGFAVERIAGAAGKREMLRCRRLKP